MSSASSTSLQPDSDYAYSPRWYSSDHQLIRSLVALPFSQNNLELLGRCIQDTSNPFMQDHLSMTPLHHAVHTGNIDAIRLLISHGHPLNVSSSDGFTPLHLAAHVGRTPVVRLLVDNGANPLLLTHDGNTALHSASQELRVEPVRYLLEHGLDPRVRNKNQFTPRLLARTRKDIRPSDRIRYNQISTMLRNGESKRRSLESLLLDSITQDDNVSRVPLPEPGAPEELVDEEFLVDKEFLPVPKAKRLRFG